MLGPVKRFLDELQISQSEIVVAILMLIGIVGYTGVQLWMSTSFDSQEPEPKLLSTFKAVADSALRADSLEMMKFTNPEKYLEVAEQPKKAAKKTSLAGLKVNVNTAELDELTKLPGIGPATAGNIIEYRNENGPFTSVEDLIKVKRIGPKTLERIRSYLSL